MKNNKIKIDPKEEQMILLKSIRMVEGKAFELEYLKQHRELMINYGLRVNHDKQMEQMRAELKQITAELGVEKQKLEDLKSKLAKIEVV